MLQEVHKMIILPFLVFDITQLYHIEVVAKYRDNEIKPLLFPTKIHEVAKSI